MEIISGIALSRTIKEEIKQEVSTFLAKGLRRPKLVAVLVGSDGPSQTYVNAKVKDCHQVGFESEAVRLDENTSEEVLLAWVEKLNADPSVDGFIVQLPLPKGIDESKVLLAIDPAKDVDGFHPVNIGNMALGLPGFVPATPAGVIQMLKRSGIDTSGKHCVIIGRSKIVGMPLSILLARNSNPGNCTVTLTHSRTKNLKEICKEADILIAALGKPGFIKADMIKAGAVIIDVGISRVETDTNEKGYIIQGDVDFDSVSEKVGFISPVPGGVGPMTRTSLLTNTLTAYKRSFNLK
jgi:methylenetetrahydrofolate dehydrogenase (NADP+) / methenyltetrahydrofolate cyclohydrolase